MGAITVMVGAWGTASEEEEQEPLLLVEDMEVLVVWVE